MQIRECINPSQSNTGNARHTVVYVEDLVLTTCRSISLLLASKLKARCCISCNRRLTFRVSRLFRVHFVLAARLDRSMLAENSATLHQVGKDSLCGANLSRTDYSQSLT